MLVKSVSIYNSKIRSRVVSTLRLSLGLHRIAAGGIALASVISPTALLADTQLELSPQELVTSMSQALKTLNYEGTYVNFHGSNLTTMHILHASHSDGEFKRLSILDDEECEITEDESEDPCVLSNVESVLVSGSNSLDTQLPTRLTSIDSDVYTFTHSKIGRVAGRSAHIVNVESVDDMRYGYRFWIDAETHMLLRSMMFEGEGPPVDQMMFTQIEFPENVDLARFNSVNLNNTEENNSELEATVEGGEVAANVIDESAISGAAAEPGSIKFKGLPEGYEKVSEKVSTMPESYGPIRHVMFSDGMASVSVYVEYVADLESGKIADGYFIEGLSKLGSTNAFGVKQRSTFITAVGEAPEATVKAFANAVVLSE